MGRDASLDDFLDDGGSDRDDEGGGDADDGEGAVDGPAKGGGDEDPSGSDAVDAAIATHDFSPDGAACAACGAVVERRWRDDAGLVCADCKDW